MKIFDDIKIKDNSLPYYLKSDYTISRYIFNMNNKIHFTKVVVNGSQGSGKTNLVISITKRLNKMYNNNVLIIYARAENIIPILNEPEILIDKIPDIRNYKNIIFIYDDFSYIISSQFLSSTGVNRATLLNNYTKLRHIYNTKIITLTTIHYRTAVLPILRDTQLFLYTTMNNEMLNNMKDDKLSRYAKKYMDYMNKYYMEDKPFIINSLIDNTLKLNKIGDYHNIHNINEDDDIRMLGGEYTIIINGNRERLALLDTGNSYGFIYYNLMIDDNGKFDISDIKNMYVINNEYNNEGFNIPKDNIIQIKTEGYDINGLDIDNINIDELLDSKNE